MIDVLIFSKNRAAQLDLLLRSIEKYAPSLYRSATVLWQATTAPYRMGYAYDWYPPEVLPYLQAEQDEPFDVCVRAWLAEASDTIAFLVDDDVFHKSPPSFDHDGTPITLRAGDYDYPWSLDGCIYDKHKILERLPERFDNPTELEAGMAEWTTGPSRFRQIIPCLVGIPANRVSDSSNMPYSDDPANDPAVMNERYLKGERIDLDATLAGVKITGAHQQIPYVWRKA